MNILLTGGAGYIGSHIAVSLGNAGHDVIILDNFCNSNRSVLGQIQKILGKELSWIEGDVRDTKLIACVLSKYKINSVIHLAGLKSVGDSITSPIEYYANNIQGTISLLQAMQMTQIKNLIFSSSATIYGEPKYLPIDEAHPKNAINSYGRTKLHIEDMLRDLAESDLAWKIISLRYFNPAGAHESGLIGEEPNGIPNNLMPYIAQVAVNKLPKLIVYGDDYETPDGSGIRDYIHVMDLAEGHLAAFNYLDLHKGWDAFNLGMGMGYSVYNIMETYEKACGHKIDFEVKARRRGDVSICYADVSKARKVLGWKAHRDLEVICSSTLNFQKSKVITVR
jgi:UDP-glucose 4-epimerase